jgi:hypothetical protein
MKEILNAMLRTLISISDSYYLFFFTGQWGLDGEDGEWIEFGSAVDLCARHAAIRDAVEEAWDGGEGNSGWVFADDSSKTPGWAYSVSSFKVQVIGEACTIFFSDSKGEKGRLELAPGECRVAKALPGRTHGRLSQFLKGLREAGIHVDSSFLDRLQTIENPIAHWNPIYEDPQKGVLPLEPRASSRESAAEAAPKPYMDAYRIVSVVYKDEVLAEIVSRNFILPKPEEWQTRHTEASRQRKARLASKALRLARRIKANNKSSC